MVTGAALERHRGTPGRTAIATSQVQPRNSPCCSPRHLPLSTAALTRMAGLILDRRRRSGSQGWALDPGQQALLALAHLHKGERSADRAAGFGISATTACRRICETARLLAAQAPGLQAARTRSGELERPSSSSTAP